MCEAIVTDSSPRPVLVWNRMIDFKASGIAVILSDNARVRGNVARFNHLTTAPGVIGPITFGIYVAADGSQVLDNLVASPSSAGATTPRLAEGLVVEGGETAVVRGNRVRHTTAGMRISFQPNSDVIGNRILNSGADGLVLTGVSDGSIVRNNFVRGSGGKGVLVNGAQTGEMTQFTNNDFRFNAGLDCDDDTTGGGTASTASIWTNNFGIDDDPDGICINTSSP